MPQAPISGGPASGNVGGAPPTIAVLAGLYGASTHSADDELLLDEDELLDDDDDWVKVNATGALQAFGKKAAPYLPKLRKLAAVENKQLNTWAKRAITVIEAAKDTSAAEKKHQAALEQIKRFCKMRPQRKDAD